MGEPSGSPHFQAFRWTRPEVDTLQVEARHLNQLIGQVIDVTYGVRVLLELMEQDAMALIEASRLCEWVEGTAAQRPTTCRR